MWTEQAREDYRMLEALRPVLAQELEAASSAHDVERVRQITKRQEENAWRQQSIIYQMNVPGARRAYRGPDGNYRPSVACPSGRHAQTSTDRQHGRGERRSRRVLDPDAD